MALTTAATSTPASTSRIPHSLPQLHFEPPPPVSSSTPRTIHSRSTSTSSPRLRKSGHASTPNLHAAFRSSVSGIKCDSGDSLVPPVPRLPRKQSLQSLQPLNPLAQSINPSAQSYHNSAQSFTPSAHSLNNSPLEPHVLDLGISDENTYPGMPLSPTRKMPLPATPGRMLAGDDGAKGGALAVGDVVDVPGNMYGTVKFIGTVAGKKGAFAGVELANEFKARGKNNGDVDGVSYFETEAPGAGIFLPLNKAARRAPSPLPNTPTTLKPASQNATNYTAYSTPPTVGLPKPQSTAKARISSPEGKKMRQSLARPESPSLAAQRRLSAAPGGAGGVGRASIGPAGIKTASRLMTTPTVNRFAQSVRGTAGDPAKNLFHKKSPGPPRPNSALGQTSMFDDDEPPAILQGIMNNKPSTNNMRAMDSPSNSRLRPSSRADGEVERLRAQLEDRERQLTEQSATLNEMESSLSELQSLIESPDMGRRGSLDGKNAQQLRAMLREKNERISQLTAEFDAHRADFRSTIDALETASSETQKLYEKRIEELMQEIKDLEATGLGNLDVNTVAHQLRQLEELVQELEEGLEDARRGEAEARGEVEFLRGEVERTRAELRREREKSGGGGSRPPTSKELEQKDDEIRGLKAIIHSLSRNAVPGGSGDQTLSPPRPTSSGGEDVNDALGSQDARDQLEHEIEELQSMLNDNTHNDDEGDDAAPLQASVSSAHAQPTPRSRQVSASSHSSVRNSDHRRHDDDTGPPHAPEEDTHSTTATEHSSQWCEMCESSGHDILSCGKITGNATATADDDDIPAMPSVFSKSVGPGTLPPMAKPSAPRSRAASLYGKDDGTLLAPPRLDTSFAPDFLEAPRPLTPGARSRNGTPGGTTPVRAVPNPLDAGPVAGKTSRVVDETKWCALCERDGHDSVDCPFEDAF